jgi:hypothetical protein
MNRKGGEGLARDIEPREHDRDAHSLLSESPRRRVVVLSETRRRWQQSSSNVTPGHEPGSGVTLLEPASKACRSSKFQVGPQAVRVRVEVGIYTVLQSNAHEILLLSARMRSMLLLRYARPTARLSGGPRAGGPFKLTRIRAARRYRVISVPELHWYVCRANQDKSVVISAPPAEVIRSRLQIDAKIDFYDHLTAALLSSF